MTSFLGENFVSGIKIGLGETLLNFGEYFGYVGLSESFFWL